MLIDKTMFSVKYTKAGFGLACFALFEFVICMYSVWQIMINNTRTVHKEFRFLLFNLGY